MSDDRSRIIEDWPSKNLTCVTCGETRSVKYSYKGDTYCNACVIQAKKDRWYGTRF